IINELSYQTTKIVMTSKIKGSYNPNAKDENVDKLLDTIGAGNEEIIQLLKEVIGYTLYRKNIFGKSFIFKGDGGNGKSTLLNTISALLGHDDITSFSLSELGDRLHTGMLSGKLANIGANIASRAV